MSLALRLEAIVLVAGELESLLESNDECDDHDVDKKVLGSGNFASVKKCVRKSDGEQFAVKIIDKSKVEDMGDIEREVEIMGGGRGLVAGGWCREGSGIGWLAGGQ